MAEPTDSTALVPTLRVRVVVDTVFFDLVVANAGEAPLTLSFATSQRYDFGVVDESGAEIWRWSTDRMFGQALSEESVPAGGVLEYHEMWLTRSRGRFRAEAWLVSTDHPLELQTDFEVPAE